MTTAFATEVRDGVAPASGGIDVSVVVCTYNRAELLPGALASVQALVTDSPLAYEIVVVNNASTDDTPRVIEAAARNSPVPLRGVYEPRPGVVAARNRGIHEARGEWIAFFDDDQIADPRWLAELLAMTREKSIRCAGGGCRLSLPPGGPYDLGPEFRGLLGENGAGDAPQRAVPGQALGTGNLLVHRGVFAEIGVFNEEARDGGEDTDLFGRMFAAGIEAWYTPRAFSFHVVPPYRLTPAYLRWKSIRGGGHIARRNWKAQGRPRFLFEFVARLGQALCLHLPRLAFARLAASPASYLDRRCLLWRSEGYLRYALSYLAPRLFAQRAFFEEMEFRSEREKFAEEPAHQ